MAESELGVLSTQSLDRCFPDKQNRRMGGKPQRVHAKADWQFTTDGARIKLRKLYPQFE
jgi:hypothetical protein